MPAIPFKKPFEATYFDKGQYLCEITKVSLNGPDGDEPCVSFKVVDSHDGRRIRAFTSVYFHTGEHRTAKQRQFKRSLFYQLLSAIDLDENSDLEDMIGKTATLYYREAGRDVTPYFSSPDNFGVEPHKQPRVVIEQKVSGSDVNQAPQTQASPDENWPDDIPF